ncbi:MAG TPA: TrkH family potassium uptake protein [Methanotrichaceae archaeon]|nr:TrkH family potassium uptake protein [Methanotrichaceae archaeon]
MRFRVFLRLFGSLLKLLAVVLLVPGAVAAYYGETRGVIAFALTSLLTLASGIVLGRLGSDEEMGHKEGFALVAFGWLGAAFFGALPYIFLGTSMLNGFFESMSSFTTTGASTLTEYNAQGYWIINSTLANQSLASALEGGLNNLFSNSTLFQPREDQTYFGLLFWRSFAQWLGGMGIILLFIAILPRLGVAGRQLYRAEVPGPDKDALTPRIRQTARILWWVYVLLTVAEVVLLVVAGMPLYDSLCNTFASMATGGFSPQAASIAAYNSTLIDAIIVLFMFLAGANFALHYRMLYFDRKILIRDPEFRLYTLIILAATAIIVLWGGIEGDIFNKIRLSIFQVVSMMTTTGFATADFDRWTAAAKFTLLLLMFIGACAGSTGGAIKVVRVLLVLKSGYRELFQALHPKAVLSVKLGRVTVRDEILRPSNIFVALYLIIFAVASLLLAIASYGDPRMDITAITSAVATTLGNVGPGFGMVGPMYSFAEVHPLGKIILMLCMWIGRLEVVTALVLLVPEFWKK